MNWEDAVSVDSFHNIENILECNLYLLDVENLPILNTTMTLYQSFLCINLNITKLMSNVGCY